MKKLLSFVLTFVMVVGLVPSPALAEAMDEMGVVLQEEVLPDESEPEEEVPTEELDSSEESDAADLEELEIDEVEALGDEEPTGPQSIWIEENIGDSGFDPYWISNSMLNPMYEFRIRASNTEGGSSSSEDAYLWQNATDTITFVSTASESATYDVALRSDRTHIGGLFYEDDGLMLPLPGGTYTIVFTGEGGVQYSTSSYGFNGRYTVDGDAGIIFRGYYGADNQGAFTRDAFAVYNEGGSTKLETVPFGGKLDLDLEVALTAAVENAPAPTGANLYMYKARDGEGDELTLEQLEEQYAAESIDDWPNPFYWNATRTNERIVWSRANPTTGSNATTWSLTANGEDSKEGTFSIRGIDLTKKDGTNPALEPGVYFPVLQLRVDGKTYKFAYNPVEVATTNTTQTNPTIVTQTLPAAMKGVPYATTLSARSGAPAGEEPGTFSWEVTSGTLPQGLSLNSATGAISGKPAANATTQTFTLTLTETIDGNTMTASKQYTIELLDAVELGDISYPTDTIYMEDSNGTTLHLSVPVSADLRDSSLNLSLSDVAFNVYQTERNSTNSRKWGGILEFANVYDATKHTLEIDAPIQYDTASIDRIEVSLRLKDNNGEPVMIPKEGDTTGEGDWAIITSTVESPGILMGSYVEFPVVELAEVRDAHVRLWPYVDGSVAIPQDAQQNDGVYANGAVYKLEPGTYAFAIEGEVPIYDANGQDTGTTRWVNIVESAEGYTAIPHTKPQQYKLVVGGNEGTHSMPKQLGLVYTSAHIPQPITYNLDVQFQPLAGEENQTPRNPWYTTCWYRRANGEDVLVGRGNSVELGPSQYPLYVQVTPTGRDTAFWTQTERIEVGADETQKSIIVPRKDLFEGTFTLSCKSGKTPKDGQAWGIIEVQTPLADGGTSSRNLWPVKKSGDECKVKITGLTTGSVITWTPRVELTAGPISYTVDQDASFSYTLEAPDPSGLITFEGLDDAGEPETSMVLNDGSTGVLVERVQGGTSPDVRVPYYVADGSSIVLQPESNSYTDNYYEHSETDVTYKITVTKHDKTAPDRMGTRHADYSAKKTYTVALNKNKTTATVQPDSVASLGYVVVPFGNPDALLCTLLLYDNNGNLVESGPAGKSEQLRTPFLPSGAYTLYAVDANYLPQATTTKNGLASALAASGNADRATSTTLQVTNKATTADTFAFPQKRGTAVVNQSKSWVTMESVYTKHLAVNMHAVLNKTIDLKDAHLEIQTNQPSIDIGAARGMNPQALTVNGKAVNLSQWSEDYGPVMGYTSRMTDGALDINLEALKDEIGQKNATFPMDMTLVIPQTVNGYTEASIWLVQGTGNNKVRSLVGTYCGNTEEVTLTTPAVVAWTTFGVYGDTAPKALVTIYVDGMRAATAQADAYGYYEAQITLPENAKSNESYDIVAAAQWTQGEAAYAAMSEVGSTMYSETFPAVERITLCYQQKADADYTAVRLYYRGAELNKYFTIQRDGHTANNAEDAEASKFFYLVEYANGEYIDKVTAGVPDLDTPMPTTDSLSAAKGWIPDINNTQGEDDEMYQRYAPYGWTMSSAGSLVKGALERNTTSEFSDHAFVSEPRSFSDYKEEMELEFTLKEFEQRPLVNVLQATDLGSFDGWKNEKATENVPMSPTLLASYLNGMSTYDTTRGRLFMLTDDQKGLLDANNAIDLDMLVANDTQTSALIDCGGNVHEWLLVGGTDIQGTEEKALLLEHSVVTENMTSQNLQLDLQDVMNSAEQVGNAYEQWCTNSVVPTDESVAWYQGAAANEAAVVCAGGVVTTRYKGMPYFIETMDENGDARAEWMNKYEIEGYNDTYVYCRVFLSKDSVSLTWWNEAHNQKVTTTYTLPEGTQSTQTLRYAGLLDQWYQIKTAIFANLNEGNESLEEELHEAGALSISPTEEVSSLQAHLLSSGGGSEGDPKQPPKQQSTIGEILTKIGEWKLWWDGNDKDDNVIHNTINNAREDDPANVVTPGSKFWESEAAQSGNVGGVNQVGKKAKAVGTVMERGTEKFIEDRVGSTCGPAGRLFWLMDHDDWLAEKRREFTDEEERDFREWNDLKWKYEEYPYLQTDAGIDRYFYLMHKYGDKTDDWFRRHEMQVYMKTHKKAYSPKKKADPSGIVYEAVLSNPVEGATVTLYEFNKAAAAAGIDPAQFIDSLQFGIEDNPQVTSASGRYKWDVPEGFWQVRVSKEGYEDASTGSSAYGLDATTDLDGDGTDDGYGYWMPVLPIQLDVNIPLVSKEPPKVETVVVDETGVTVTFSKYMKVDTISADLFTINGSAPASVRATDAEAAGDGSVDESGQPVMLARTFRLGYASGAPVDPGAEVAVAFQDEEGSARSYAGVAASAKNRTYQTTAAAQESRVSIAGATVALSATTVTYNGKQAKPSVASVKLNGATLVAGTDYSVSYKNNVSAGTASVVITGKGEYKGTVTKNFTIAQAAQTITVSATKSVAMGKTASLGAKTNGDGKLTYKSSNTKVVKVSATGVLTPVAKGKATVTVSCAAGKNYKAAAAKKVTVTVTQGTQTVTATNKECVLGKTVSLGAKASGGTKLTYKSSNTKVATVSAKGVVTGKKAGKVTITITAAANTNWKSATKKVTVKVGKANPLVCKAKKATVVVAYSKVKSAAQVTALNVSTTKAQGTLTYANASTNTTAKKFTVNKTTGKVAVPKGTAKGKYQVKIKVKAAGNSTYISGTKTVVYYIQVK